MKHIAFTLGLWATCGAAAALGQTPFDQCTCDPLVMMIEDNLRSDVICPGSQTRDALLQTWGASRPDGAQILVISRTTGLTNWAPPGSTPDGLASAAGTVPGFTGSAAERVACISAGASQICPAPNRNALGQIQPRDGLWRSTLGAMTVTGCPANVAGAMATATPGAVGQGEQRRSFSDPFHPRSLMIGIEQGNQTWTDLPSGGWQTDFVPQVINQQQAAGASTHVLMSMQVTCDTRIEGATDIIIEVPEVARALMGIAPEGCRVQQPYAIEWLGE